MAKRQVKPPVDEPVDSDEVVEMDDAAVTDDAAEDVVPDIERHVFLDGAMKDIADIGIDNPRERHITFDGVNYEHVTEHKSGCWAYRRM